LTDVVEDKGKTVDPGWRWEIWRRVFNFAKNTPEILDRLSKPRPQKLRFADLHLNVRDFHGPAEDLAEQIREGCVDRGEMAKLAEMWEALLRDTAKQPAPLWRKEFWEVQLALCFFELGEGGELLRLVREGPKLVLGLNHHSIGRRLALKKVNGLLAECWSAISNPVYRYEFLEGVTDGFKKAGDIKGLILMAKQLGTVEKMQDMMNMVEGI
jgi:hypothetical protein